MKLIPTSRTKIGIVALISTVGFALPALATGVDFEGFPGPTVFSSATPIPAKPLCLMPYPACVSASATIPA